MGDCTQILIHTDFGKDRFPCDAALPLDDAGRGAVRQINVHAATKADQADTLARGNNIALFDKGDDTARHQTRNLGEAYANAIGAFDQEMLALIFLARLVEIGIEELAAI